MIRDVVLATATDVIRWGFVFVVLVIVAVVLGIVRDSARRERAQMAAWKRRAAERDREAREAWERWSR